MNKSCKIVNQYCIMNVENLTRKQLLNLSVEQLNGLTARELKLVADKVLDRLEDTEIEELPKDVLEKLRITRERTSFGFGATTWIALIIGAIIVTLIQAAQGR